MTIATNTQKIASVGLLRLSNKFDICHKMSPCSCSEHGTHSDIEIHNLSVKSPPPNMTIAPNCSQKLHRWAFSGCLIGLILVTQCRTVLVVSMEHIQTMKFTIYALNHCKKA